MTFTSRGDILNLWRKFSDNKEYLVYQIKGGIEMKKLIIVLLSLILMVSGCVVSLTSYKDPNYADKILTKILVVASIQDLQTRMMAEKTFVNSFTKKNIVCVSSMDIIPPTRQLDADQISTIIIEQGFDSVMILNLIDFYTTTTHIEGSTNTSGNASVYGNNIYHSENTYKNPGYDLEQLTFKVDIKIYDSSNGNVIWIANSTVQGNAYDTLQTMIPALSSTVISKMKTDGLISYK